MSDWRQGSQQTAFNAGQYTQELSQMREGQRSTSGLNGGFFGIGGNMASSSYSVVGINTNEIPNMRQAIRNYVQRIHEHLDTINTTTDPTVALKGTGIESSVQEYIVSVSKYCKALTSQLLAFSDKLAKVQEAWEASDANLSQTVRSSAEEAGSSSSRVYTEQFKG